MNNGVHFTNYGKVFYNAYLEYVYKDLKEIIIYLDNIDSVFLTKKK